MRRGFTVIELLIAIAIIAILASILFPVFLRAKENARTTECASHGRELGMALLMYIDDNNGCCPCTLSDSEMGQPISRIEWQGTQKTFLTQLWSLRFSKFNSIYVRNSKVWICPNVKGDLGTRYAYGYKQSWIPRLQDEFLPSGGSKGDLGLTSVRKVDSEGRCAGRTLAEIEALDRRSPREKIAWYCATVGSMVPTPPVFRRGTYPYYPHNRGSIYVYLDGHAKWARTGGYWAPVGYLRYDEVH